MLTMQIGDCVANGGKILFVGTKKAGSGLNLRGASRALRYVLCKREMVRRYAYKL